MEEKPHVLIVEDDAFYREFLERTLMGEYTIHVAEDGRQALSKVEQHTFDAILCDLRLPGMSGKDLIRHIRELTDDYTILIIVTGFEQDLSPVDASDSHVFSYLKKGQFGPPELRKILRNGIALRKQRQGRKKYADQLLNSKNDLENKVAEGSRALSESRTKYRNLFEQSLVGIYIEQQGRIRLANRKFCEILGYPPEELENQSIDSFISPILNQISTNRLVHSDSENLHESLEEVLLTPRDNSLRNALHCAGTVSFQGAEAVQGCILDITEWKVLEQQILQNQKLEALGTLVSGISHEFNNILAAIMPQAELLLQQSEDNPRIRRPAEILFTMAEKASRLTSQLLNMGRKTVMEKRPVEVNNWLREALGFLGSTLGDSIQVVLSLDHNAGMIEADPHHLDQLLLNLVINARDAMPEDGKIRISTSVRPTRSGLPGTRRDPNLSFVEITIEDTGCGITPRDMPNIFDPFFTTKEAGQGTGLGLSVVHNLIKQNNGEIFATSNPGQGTTFRIVFPRAASAEAEPRRPTAGKILVAEHNPGMRNLLQDVLSKMSYEVIPALDDQEAVEIYARQKDTIDVVIMDSQLRGRAQDSPAGRMLGLNPRIKMILTYDETEKYISPLPDGTQRADAEIEYLSLPTTPEILTESLEKVLRSGTA